MKITILALHLNIGKTEKFISDLVNVLANNHEVEVVSFYKFSEKPFFDIDSRVKVTYLTSLKPKSEEFKRALKSFNVVNIIKEGIRLIKIARLKRILQIRFIKNLSTDVIITTKKEQSARVSKYCSEDILKIATEHKHHKNSQNYVNELVSYTKNMDKLVLFSKELTDFYKERFQYTSLQVEYIKPVVYSPTVVSNLKNNRVLSIGTVNKDKGYDDLLAIAKCLQNLEFDIVGDGPYYNELEKQIESEKLTNVTLHSVKTEEDLEKLYLNSSLFLMTSKSLSYGLVLIEAMSYGLPCVAFNDVVSALEVIKDKENGFIVESRDISTMVNTIKNYFSSDKKSMQLECIKTSANYSLSNFAISWNEIISSKDKK